MHANEIEFFEEILKSRREQIIKNIGEVESELDQLQEMELNDEGDYAAASNDHLVENAIGVQQDLELHEIEDAILRIKDGTYGICDMCEDPIGPQRLKVKAHAKYCMDCRTIVEKNGE